MIDIVLVEDNLELATLIKTLLSQKGFSVCNLQSGEEFLKWIKTNTPKIIILDIMLPGIDGFAICQEIRNKGNTPIIMMSAKSDKSSQLLGFELGADDYLEKPVDLDILSAKIQAIWSRYQKKERKLISGTLMIDTEAHQVFVNKKLIELNLKEYELLLLLVQNEGKTLHKNYLFHKIWGIDSFSEEQTLTVHIKMLRSKIEENPREPKRIITVWGVGYRYEKI